MNLKNWIRKPAPKSMNFGSGWVREFDRCYVDAQFNHVVLIRTIDTEWGKVEHAAIRNADSQDVPWAIKQQIKNDLFGEDRVAIEVFPEVSQLIDGAMMYHIWVLPAGFKMPFSLKSQEVSQK